MTATNWLIFALLVGALVWLLRTERRHVSSTTALLLRSLLPSFRFFEAIDPPPQLDHRVVHADGRHGPWLATLHPPVRGPLFPLLNARGNLHLACASLVEHLASDLDEQGHEGAEALTSYRLVASLVQSKLTLSADERFQFRLRAEEDPAQSFVSAVHGLLPQPGPRFDAVLP